MPKPTEAPPALDSGAAGLLRGVVVLSFLGSVGACFDPEAQDPPGETSTTVDSTRGDSSGDSTGPGATSGVPGSSATTDPEVGTDSGRGPSETSSGAETTSSSSSTGPEPLCDDGIPAPSEICFDGAAVLESSDVAYAPRLGDANGDSNPDVVYGNSDTLVIRLGDGLGGFGPELQDGEFIVTGTELGDIDGDGVLDIVGVDQYADSISTRLGTPAAGFASVVNGPTAMGPAALVLGDLNGDGRDDVVVLHAAGESLRSYVAGPAGSLSAVAFVGTGPGTLPGRELALGDFTGDGALDAAFTVDGDSPKISIGDGLGDFGIPIDVGVVTSDAFAIAAADFDQDGDDDLAIGDGSELTIVFGTGAAAFSNPTTLDLGGQIRALESVDLSNDGVEDLIVSYTDTASISILPNLGDGTFGTAVELATGTPCESLSTGDANQDGVLDIILGCDFVFVRVLLSAP
ncbi:MAG: VCBS repeat-containing protein [Nannocystaceae bacterium]|nr:VCBS repeat-containing protein [Nannocystaceae bacterium]